MRVHHDEPTEEPVAAPDADTVNPFTAVLAEPARAQLGNHEGYEPTWAANRPAPPRPTVWGAVLAPFVAVGVPLAVDLVVRSHDIPARGAPRNWTLVLVVAAAALVGGLVIGALASEGRRQSTLLRGLWALGLSAASTLLLIQIVRLHPIMFGMRLRWFALLGIIPVLGGWWLGGSERL